MHAITGYEADVSIFRYKRDNFYRQILHRLTIIIKHCEYILKTLGYSLSRTCSYGPKFLYKPQPKILLWPCVIIRIDCKFPGFVSLRIDFQVLGLVFLRTDCQVPGLGLMNYELLALWFRSLLTSLTIYSMVIPTFANNVCRNSHAISTI